jgi:RHS repeat-associated protein
LRQFTHDSAGNIITDVRGATTYIYRYNNRGRLDRVTVGASTVADYAYDGLERMSVRTTQNMTPAGTTHYMYDRSGRVITEATGSGTIQREYVWVDDMPLALFADMHPDHLNRPVKMTDTGKAVVWDAWYWPFGDARYVTGTATNNLRFPGQYYLAESGLHYNWHRHYDPTVGRYMEPDPIADVRAMQTTAGADHVLQGAPTVATQIDLANSLPEYSESLRVGSELSEFMNGPNIYAYAKLAPIMNEDRKGLAASGPFTPIPRPSEIKSCGFPANDNTPPGMCRPLPSGVMPTGNRVCIYLCPDGSYRRLEIMATYQCPKWYY